MSQAKVDQYKKEKYERKHPQKKSMWKRAVKWIIAGIIAAALVFLLGIYVGYHTGLIKPEVATTHVEKTPQEIESIRNALIQQGDKNVKGPKTTAASSVTPATKAASKKATSKKSTKTSNK